MTTAERLRKARGRLTQKQAAQLIGCPLPTYRDWEQGRRNPPGWLLDVAVSRLEAQDDPAYIVPLEHGQYALYPPGMPSAEVLPSWAEAVSVAMRRGWAVKV